VVDRWNPQEGPLKKKTMASLAMLVSWKIWKERNARIFETTSTMLVEKIKEEATVWCLAGANGLGNVMLQE
jgi:hypothetical protein